MTDSTRPSRATGLFARLQPVLVLPAVILAAVVMFAPPVLNDPDTYWHLKTGMWILDHRAIPTVDPFSHTVAGQPWVAQEWLSEALMAAAFRLAGWSGVLALFGIAAGIAAAAFARHLSKFVGVLTLSVCGLLALGGLAPSLLARPHLLTVPLIVLWTGVLMQARADDRAPPLASALILTLWANLHGSYLLALLLAGGFGLEALVEAQDRRKALMQWAVFGLACAAASLVTPHGLAGITYPIKIMTMSALPGITEWRPADFSTFSLFELGLLATVFFCLWKGVRVPVVRLLLLLALLHLALEHSRHQFVLAVVAPLILAPSIGAVLAPDRTGGGAAGRWAPAAVAVGLLIVVGARLAMPLSRGEGPATPMAALDHVPAALRAQPVFNEYDFGGFLIFKGVRPFIDGRSDMYGDRFTMRYFKAEAGDKKTLDALLDQYRVSWTILRPQSPAVAVLDHEPGWRRAYADAQTVVHVRDH